MKHASILSVGGSERNKKGMIYINESFRWEETVGKYARRKSEQNRNARC